MGYWSALPLSFIDTLFRRGGLTGWRLESILELPSDSDYDNGCDPRPRFHNPVGCTEGQEMIVTCVIVHVKEENVEAFIAATAANHEASIQEPGNMRFDVLQCREDRTRFLLYEAYESDEAAKAHKDTEHYKKWRHTVADWMAKPREGIAHDVIRPMDRDQW